MGQSRDREKTHARLRRALDMVPTPPPDRYADSRSVEVRLLGLPCVLVGGQPLKIVSARGVFEMLARIARSDADAHERDAVARDVWPELTLSEGRAALRRHLHYLDRALTAAGAQALVHRDGQRLRLGPGVRDCIDVHRFEWLAEHASTPEAIAAYGGEYLESHENLWVIVERNRLRDLQIQRLHARGERALAQGDIAAARQSSGELRRLDPLAESGLRLEMAARAAAGDGLGALAACDAFEKVLRADLAVGLSAATSALRARIAAAHAAPGRCFGFPAQTTRFFGRDRDIAGVIAALRNERLVTVVGSPGMGKTRLALRVAHNIAEADDLAAYFVDASPLRDPETIAAAVLEALASNPLNGTLDRNDLAAGVRGKALLLLLDNCEHAADAVRSVVLRILQASPDARVLATSRIVLDAQGERLYALEPLAPAHAIELFVDRARLVRPQFRLTAQNRERIAALCERFDGLPLAIELAAGRLRSTSIGTLLPAAVPLTLRATFEWSIQLLDVPDRRLFARLACFAGAFSVIDAAELDEADRESTAARLARLVDHSLVRSPCVSDDFPLYALLEPLREFGAALLAEAGEAESLRERHARLFAVRYVSRSEALNGARAHEFAAEVERDRNNVRAALETLVDGGADLTLGAELCLALQRSWFLQGQVVDGVRWTERLLSRIELDPALRIKILFMRAVMARHQYDYREAIRRYRELLAFHRAAGDAKRVALTLIHLAGCLCTVGETDAAKTCALEGLDALAPDDSYFIGHAYVALGLAENYAGHVSEAEAAHREALARFVTSESAADVSVCLSNLATCALERDDLASAETYAAESIAQAEKARASVAIGASLCVLGNVAIARGDVAAACAHARAATNVARETNDHERLAEVFEVGVRIALAQADPASAARFFGVADALRARCFAVRARLEALAFDALAERLRDRLGASRLDALRVTGGTMAVPDALEALEDLLTGPHAISLAR